MKLANTNRFYLPGTGNRFLHLATVFNGPREYMCFIDKWEGDVYIEEITGGSLEFIKDESLAKELHNFLVESMVLMMNTPALPDSEWLKKK